VVIIGCRRRFERWSLVRHQHSTIVISARIMPILCHVIIRRYAQTADKASATRETHADMQQLCDMHMQIETISPLSNPPQVDISHTRKFNSVHPNTTVFASNKDYPATNLNYQRKPPARFASHAFCEPTYSQNPATCLPGARSEHGI
jgi:hypothetical protein